MKRRSIAATTCLLAVAGLGAAPIANAAKSPAYTFHDVAVQASGRPCTNNRVFTINDKGVYGGTFYCHNKARAFLAKPGRKFALALLHGPGGPTTDTFLVTLANNGDAALYTAHNFKPPNKSYIRFPDNVTWLPVKDPDAGSAGTIISGLNSHGVAVGTYQIGGAHSKFRSFVFTVDGGAYQDFSIDRPAAVETELTGINDRGDMSGVWFDAKRGAHPFLVINGKTTYPHLAGGGDKKGEGVYISTIASNDDYVGLALRHGETTAFVMHHGKRVDIGNPVPKGGKIAGIDGINRKDVVVGTYYGKDHLAHGFIGRPN